MRSRHIAFGAAGAKSPVAVIFDVRQQAMHRVSILPAICYAVLFVFACCAAVQIGHWPYYAHPDPKDLPSLRTVYRAASYATLMGLVSVILLPVGHVMFRAFAAWRKWRIDQKTRGVALYCAGATLWIIDVVFGLTYSRWSLISWVFD